jgi:D-glycero-D-manno-heptose 1,7-bisphosphate phosphatase
MADASRFGAVELMDDGRVAQFTEKGRDGSAWINAGVYFMEPAFLAGLPHRPSSLETDLFPRALGIYGYRGGGRFIDIGVPASYSRATETWRCPAATSHGALVLVDRDGTLNREVHHLSKPEQVVLLPGAARAMRRMRDLGLGIAVVTNQSAVGRGLLDTVTLDAVHARLWDLMDDQGASWDWIGYCPHLPGGGCRCRKPKPGLAQAAATALGRSLSGAFVIGDKGTDLGMGRAIGATNLLVRTGYGATEPTDLADHVVEDVWCAAVRIEQLLQGERREH